VIYLSAKTGEGLETLRQHLKKIAGWSDQTEGLFTARRRHLEALERAKASLLSARHQAVEGYSLELLAEDLRQSQLALSEITGDFTSDDLLDRIFSSFCVGK
jgi:tRNA modification GTPase